MKWHHVRNGAQTAGCNERERVLRYYCSRWRQCRFLFPRSYYWYISVREVQSFLDSLSSVRRSLYRIIAWDFRYESICVFHYIPHHRTFLATNYKYTYENREDFTKMFHRFITADMHIVTHHLISGTHALKSKTVGKNFKGFSVLSRTASRFTFLW